MNYDISVIIPAYNSADTLEMTLKSVRRQRFDQKRVQILVIDGGSADRTREIAGKYGASVIDNPKRLPEPAKLIGIRASSGKYGVFLDSDEIFRSSRTFERRFSFLETHENIKNMVSSGRLNAPGAPGVVRYANAVGDPFSNFVYLHYNGYDRIRSMKKAFPHREEGSAVIYDLSRADFLPLYDAGGHTFDLSFVKEMLSESGDPENLVSNLFDKIVLETGVTAQLKGDPIYHIPPMDPEVYRRKLRWRIINSLFGSIGGVGFAERRKTSHFLRRRQYGYVLYCTAVFPVIYDAFRMALMYGDAYFLSHVYWNYYVFFNIAYYCGRKLLNRPTETEKGYGK